VELVFLPTYASWLNWIEPEFAALRYFALNGTDHRSHAEQGEAIACYMRWRNTRAEPKHGFAPGSVIRTWTGHQNKVASRSTSLVAADVSCSASRRCSEGSWQTGLWLRAARPAASGPHKALANT
jgi:hypothetical protein